MAGSRVSPPRWDFLLALLGVAVSIAVFLLPRAPVTVAIGLLLLLVVLLHPFLSIAAWLRIRSWVALTLLVTLTAVMGYFAWPSAQAHPLTAIEIAAEVVRQTRQSTAHTEQAAPVIAQPPANAAPKTQTASALRPVVRDSLFSILVPLNTGSGLPIPPFLRTVDEVLNGVDARRAERYRWLGMLEFNSLIIDAPISRATSINQLDPTVISIVDRNKPHTNPDRVEFMAEAVQYYIIQQFDELQKDHRSTTVTIGADPELSSSLGIHPPDMISIPAANLLKAIGGNRFSRCDRMDYLRPFHGRVYWVPKATVIALRNKTLPDGRPSYTVMFSNTGVYRLAVTVEQSPAFGPSEGAIYKTTSDVMPQSVWSVPFDVKCHFEFARAANTDTMQQEEYTKWAERLFAGLGGKLAD